jgi:hypothetical protein
MAIGVFHWVYQRVMMPPTTSAAGVLVENSTLDESARFLLSVNLK